MIQLPTLIAGSKKFHQSQVSGFKSENDSKPSMPIRDPENAVKTPEISVKRNETNDDDLESRGSSFFNLGDEDFGKTLVKDIVNDLLLDIVKLSSSSHDQHFDDKKISDNGKGELNEIDDGDIVKYIQELYISSENEKKLGGNNFPNEEGMEDFVVIENDAYYECSNTYQPKGVLIAPHDQTDTWDSTELHRYGV